MKKIEKAKAIELRKEGRSEREIASLLGVSKGSVSYWVREVILTDEQKNRLDALSKRQGIVGIVRHSEITLEKRKEYQRRGIEISKICTKEYAMGCMLFWAEGNKERTTVRLVNTDRDMVRFFVDFLKQYFNCEVKDFTIRVDAYLDNGKTSTEIENYWVSELGLSRECLRKSVFKNGNGTGGKYPNGVCSVSVYSVEIAQTLYGSIQGLLGIDRSKEWLNLR